MQTVNMQADQKPNPYKMQSSTIYVYPNGDTIAMAAS